MSASKTGSPSPDRLPQSRKVTRSFVLGLAAFVAFLGLALLVAAWGLLALATHQKPVRTNLPFEVAPIIVAGAVLVLYWMLWLEALRILRGRASAAWKYSFLAALAGYLIWAIFGAIAGMTVQETWRSPFALLLAAAWFVSVHVFWLILVRQVYTTRTRPLWPWEKRELRESEAEAMQPPLSEDN